jgi:hypothetical protein
MEAGNDSPLHSKYNLPIGQIWLAARQYKHLPYTFIYLLASFLLADVGFFVYSACFFNLVHSIQGLNTTGTLVSICQNDKFSFSFLKSTYLGLAQAITSTAATLGFWYIQRYFKFSTKRMVSKVYWSNHHSHLCFFLSRSLL